ncbi:MAG: hypothetical protein MUE52_09510 [Tabrizicola sp.]|nr:hypothetical protein [Tabrizicola sp.]
MRRLAVSLLALTLASPVAAQTLSQEIGANGIAPTLARLKAQPEPALEDLFAIGGLHFLSAVERALQTQWRTGADQVTGNAGDSLGLPFLRLPVPPNLAPEPFNGAVITQLFTDIDADMTAARAALAALPEGEDFGLELTFSDLWFDVNLNGSRQPEEDALAILGPQLLGWQWQERDPAAPPLTVRFDAADAAWLAAYTHVLSGVANTILAYDPAASIDRVLATRAAFGLTPPPEYPSYFARQGRERPFPGDDRGKPPLLGRRQGRDRQRPRMDPERQPDLGTRARAAPRHRRHLAWRPGRWRGAVAGPPPCPLLARRGRSGPEPRPHVRVPYLEKGPVIDSTSFRQFEALMGGNAGLMMVFLN